jgi:glycosyltransferase 2 family protein
MTTVSIDPPAPRRRTKETLFILAKVAVTLVSFYAISRSVSWGSVQKSLTNIRFEWFGLAILIFWAAQIVSALRCVYVARTLGGDLDLMSSIRAHFVGLWFNQVLPTGLGGDVVKIAILKNRIGLSIATRAVVIDRVSGLMILMFMLLIQLPLYAVYFRDLNWVVWIGLVSSISLSGVYVCAHLAGSVKERSHFPFGISHLIRVMADIWAFRKGRPLWEQFWSSLIVHLNGIVVFGLIGNSMGLNVVPILFLLVVPIVFLVALLPFSFAGWGVREAGAMWIFSAIGIPKEGALGMSVGFGMLLLIAALPGLFAYVFEK